eukprot:766976-Hanusia_phi.AAC.7
MNDPRVRKRVALRPADGLSTKEHLEEDEEKLEVRGRRGRSSRSRSTRWQSDPPPPTESDRAVAVPRGGSAGNLDNRQRIRNITEKVRRKVREKGEGGRREEKRAGTSRRKETHLLTATEDFLLAGQTVVEREE